MSIGTFIKRFRKSSLRVWLIMISYSQVFPHLLHFSVNHHEGIIVSSYFLSEKILRPDCQDIIETQSPGFLPPTLHFYFWLKTLTVCVCVWVRLACVCVFALFQNLFLKFQIIQRSWHVIHRNAGTGSQKVCLKISGVCRSICLFSEFDTWKSDDLRCVHTAVHAATHLNWGVFSPLVKIILAMLKQSLSRSCASELWYCSLKVQQLQGPKHKGL